MGLELATDSGVAAATNAEPTSVVLVLGAGSDIAVATVAALAAGRPPRVIVAAARRPEAAVAALGATAPGVAVEGRAWDALDVDGHEAFVADVVAAHGSIDVVICAVGALGHHAGSSMAPADVSAMFRTNAAGPAAALAAVAPVMVAQGSGTIVVFSSVAGARPRRSNYVYGASKAALDSFARGLADAVVDAGVDVLVVRPGFVRSKMTDGLDPAPMWRRPDDVGRVVAARVVAGRGGVVWVPRRLGWLMGVLSLAPTAVWRRVAGDR